VPSADWQVIPRTPSAQNERLKWLAHDLGTRIFLAADAVAEARLHTSVSNEQVHLGVISMHFPKCSQIAAVLQAIQRAGRQNFRLPVLTVFRVLPDGHQLTFVISETPLARTVEDVFQRIEGDRADGRPCSD